MITHEQHEPPPDVGTPRAGRAAHRPWPKSTGSQTTTPRFAQRCPPEHFESPEPDRERVARHDQERHAKPSNKGDCNRKRHHEGHPAPTHRFTEFPNGLRLSGDGGEADGVRCSRGFGGRRVNGRARPRSLTTGLARRRAGSVWVGTTNKTSLGKLCHTSGSPNGRVAFRPSPIAKSETRQELRLRGTRKGSSDSQGRQRREPR
jgi:hypothetical protein